MSLHPAKSNTSNLDSLNPLEAVLDYLLNETDHVTETECVLIKDALNRVLAKDLISEINVPPEDNSAVDGYALYSDSLNIDKQLLVSQRIPAGTSPTPLHKGTAARIFTGATIPNGADCVAMQEHTELAEDGSAVKLLNGLAPQQNIRPRGQDIKSGQTILHKGQALSPQRLGLAASIGLDRVLVYRRLKVAYFSTGDELVEPGEAIRSGQIYNSNRYLLSGLLNSFLFETIDIGVIPDNIEATKSALTRASDEADIVITTGGASVGEEDYIQSAIRALGTIDLWRVAIKPGKPFMVGKINNTPIIGLPGNPGAVFVTFMVLARPVLLRAQGLTQAKLLSVKLPIAFSVNKTSIRREYLRVKQDTSGRLTRHPNQSSGMLSSASWAEGLAIIPENKTLNEGSLVEFLPFAALLSIDG